MTVTIQSEDTRSRILESAYQEFYAHGYQGGSLNHIIERAETSKGALFHHFKGKQDLGYTVLDEVIYPLVTEDWINPLSQNSDPIATIKGIIKGKKLSKDELCHGCPLNNLAQEMSPLDETFRNKIETIYGKWRYAMEDAFKRGIKAGKVSKTVSPKKVAAFIVASIMGIIGTAKNSQSLELLKTSADGLFLYLDSLKP